MFPDFSDRRGVWLPPPVEVGRRGGRSFLRVPVDSARAEFRMPGAESRQRTRTGGMSSPRARLPLKVREQGGPAGHLTGAYNQCIIICMRTTLIIKDDILKRAAELTGTYEKTALVHAGLEALIEKKARERLAALGGCAPRFRAGRRRR